jgi:acyl-CoA synthetase (AMP-forming)/AMP-acid ligase II
MNLPGHDFQDPIEGFSTLVKLLIYRVQSQPQHKAYTFLRDGETEEVSLTDEELDQKARAISF